MARVVEALSPGTHLQLFSRTYPALQFAQQPVVVSQSMHLSEQEMSGAVVVEVGSNNWKRNNCKYNNLTVICCRAGKRKEKNNYHSQTKAIKRRKKNKMHYTNTCRCKDMKKILGYRLTCKLFVTHRTQLHWQQLSAKVWWGLAGYCKYWLSAA